MVYSRLLNSDYRVVMKLKTTRMSLENSLIKIHLKVKVQGNQNLKVNAYQSSQWVQQRLKLVKFISKVTKIVKIKIERRQKRDTSSLGQQAFLLL